MRDDEHVLERFRHAQESLVIQMADLSLRTISDMVAATAIDIAPHYQRRERWSIEKQSALIESFLLNVPVPPIYLSEDQYGQYSVIDGKQRITAIHRFLSGEFALKDLEELPELIGRTFDQLPIELKQTLSVRPYLRAVTLLKQSDPELKYEVFRRLNTGGERLEAQEVRNVVFRGSLNDLVYQLAEEPFLRRQLKIFNTKSAAYTDMTDAEYVLRFLTLRRNWNQFSGSLSRSMDDFMARNESPDPSLLESLASAFRVALGACQSIWGDKAFRRPTDANNWRDQTLAGMYDAQMIAADSLSDNERALAIENAIEVIEKTRTQFLADKQFERSVRVATNTPSSVRYRVQKFQGILRGVD
jgi:hypothetical protein